MRYLALCCDYDGTLAHDGQVPATTLAALERLRASGRRLVLVTGRELVDLEQVCPRLDLFSYVVAENGALLYRPDTRELRLLADPPPPRFAAALRERGVPVSVGRVIVATVQPHEARVLETIRDLGLELQVIFNKGAVMVLPAGVNKATGLGQALAAMGLSPHNAVGVGDAENDHAFLNLCECAVAVANALPTLREKADYVTTGDHGAGVSELIAGLLEDDLRRCEPRLVRHHILLGRDVHDLELRVPPYGTNLLLLGAPGSGKAGFAKAFVARLAERGYSYLVLDAEGAFTAAPEAVRLGTAERPPGIDEIVQLVRKPDESAVVDLAGLNPQEQAARFQSFVPRLMELRARSARPHWLVLSGAHHLLPASGSPAAGAEGAGSMLLITTRPELMARKALAKVTTAVALDSAPAELLREFAERIGQEAPQTPAGPVVSGEALAWFRGHASPAVRLRVAEQDRISQRTTLRAGTS